MKLSDDEFDDWLGRVSAERENFLSQLGEVDPFVLAPLISTSLMGGSPRWPAGRQAFRIIRKPNSTIIMSDGLSDPFDHNQTPLGFKVELCAETSIVLSNVAESWLFELVATFSEQVASIGNVYDILENHVTTLSAVGRIKSIPDSWKDEEGFTGAILGFPAKNIPSTMPLQDGKVKILTLKLLHPKELAFIEATGDYESQRNKLVKLFAGDHISDINRQSLI